MRARFLTATAIVALTALPALAAETEYPATLVGHAILPAATFVAPPADAPAALAVSAKYTTPDRHRVDALGTVPGKDGVRATGLSMPFDGQPVQGFSGIKAMDDGTFWSLSDNGFGSRMNSADAALMLHHLKFDWDAGTVERMETIFLSDPDGKVWFPIVNEGTKERYLTGADFDVESIQPVADGFWVGEAARAGSAVRATIAVAVRKRARMARESPL
ncbi:MAG: esterase-like activity of phytase family protein [Rhizobiales bacterium]|nr:esterase-like activity of phytase family protein [Hyphomicrobiales bacterium]